MIVRAQLIRVARADVERALASRPDLALHLIQRLVQRVRTLTHTVGWLAWVDMYGRLVGLFDALAVDRGQELIELRRKFKQVQQERDILAKATAWFAGHSKLAGSEKTSMSSTSS